MWVFHTHFDLLKIYIWLALRARWVTHRASGPLLRILIISWQFVKWRHCLELLSIPCHFIKTICVIPCNHFELNVNAVNIPMGDTNFCTPMMVMIVNVSHIILIIWSVGTYVGQNCSWISSQSTGNIVSFLMNGYRFLYTKYLQSYAKKMKEAVLCNFSNS